MSKRGKYFGVAVAAALVALLVAACGGEEEKEAAGARPAPAGGEVVLTVAIPAMPIGLDKDLAAGNPQTWEAIGNCYDTGLVFKSIDYPYDIPPEGKDAGYIDLSVHEPWLLESAELSPDGKSATLHIRPGVISAAGNELTAEDVKWTLERAVALQAIGYFYNVLIGLDETNPVEVIDKYTAKVNAKASNGLLATVWDDLYYSFIDSTEAKKHVTPEDPWATEWLATNCAGFGAYTVESWVPGQEVVWVANPNYFQGPPPIDRVIYRVIPDSSVRLAALQAGEIDIAEQLTPDQWLAAKDSDGVQAIGVRSGFIWFAYLNSLFEPFDDIRVRQAINYVLPRKEIAESVFLGQALSWQAAYPTINPGVNPDLWPYGDEPNFDKAKALLAEAGFPDGFDIDLSYSTALPINEQMANLIKATLAKINVRVTLNPMPDGDFVTQSYERTLPFGVWLDTPGGADPIYNVFLYYYDPATVANFGQLDDQQLQDGIDAAAQLLTLDERVKASQALQARALELSGLGNLVEQFWTIAFRDNIKGMRWHNFQDFYFRQLSKE